MHNQTYVKVFGEGLINREYQYKIGLNDLDKPFETEGNCVPGGLYFTNLENLQYHLHNGSIIKQVKIPEFDTQGNKVQMVKCHDKYRASCIEVLDYTYTFDELIPKYITLSDLVMDWACLFNNVRIFKMCIDNSIEITMTHMDNAIYNGYYDIFKLCLDNGYKLNYTDITSVVFYNRIDMLKTCLEYDNEVHMTVNTMKNMIENNHPMIIEMFSIYLQYRKLPKYMISYISKYGSKELQELQELTKLNPN